MPYMGFTVACAQFTAVDGEKEETVRKALALVRQAGERGARLVVLPEVWTGLGYSTKSAYREIAEPIPGPTTERLAEVARRYRMYITGSIYEDAGGGVYHNTCTLLGPDGRLVGTYRKTHLFDAPDRVDIKGGIRESDKVNAGDALPVFETELGPIGLSVCSDLRFPEVYRELALKGARLIVCASAFLSPRYDHWEFFLRARAAENQVWVVASGQYGPNPNPELPSSAAAWWSIPGARSPPLPRTPKPAYAPHRPGLRRRNPPTLPAFDATPSRALRQPDDTVGVSEAGGSLRIMRPAPTGDSRRLARAIGAGRGKVLRPAARRHSNGEVIRIEAVGHTPSRRGDRHR